MINETPKDRMQDIWQCQPVEGMKMSVEEIRNRAGKFEKKVMWRNVREYVSGLIAALLLAHFFATNRDPLFRTACGLIIVGLAYVTWHLHQKGSAKDVPGELGTASSLQFYRRQLERQRDLVASVWSWYLAPLVPGLILFAMSSALANPHPRSLFILVLVYGFFAGVFVFIWKLNVRAARCLQRMIDELRAAEQS